jgi:membrane protein DedA with SNARE-associated domain
MDEGTTGIFVLIIISLIVSITAHAKIKKFLLALIVSVVISCISFQVAVYIHSGYLDPFFIIAVLTSSLIIGIISTLVGLSFIYFRNKKKTS